MYHLSPLAMRCLGGPKTAPREPRGSQRVPKGAKREPKGSQREPKGRPKGAQGEAKSIKTQSFFRKAAWMVKKAIPELSGEPFEPHFESILEAKFGVFSCYFLA